MRQPNVSSSAVEGLEVRRLFCALRTGDATDAPAPTNAQIQAALAASTKKTSVVSDHNGSWYKSACTMKIRTTDATASSVGNVAVRRAVNATANVVPTASFPVNAAGLPLLTKRTDGNGLKVFLDFDGYNSDIPFDMSVSQGCDANGATFKLKEQAVIYNAWRTSSPPCRIRASVMCSTPFGIMESGNVPRLPAHGRPQGVLNAFRHH